MAMTLDIRDAVCGYGDRDVISGISFSVTQGEILCLLGPNGVGKTTLFKTLLGFLRLRGGSIRIDGVDVSLLDRRAFARLVAYVPQSHVPPFPFTVRDVVVMGRTAHLGAFASPSAEDRNIADEAMESLGISFLRDRVYTEISGGERQMALIARAIAQRPAFLVMDEPTSNLDFGNQMRVLREIRALAGRDLGVVMTSHVPNHAFLCSTRVVLMGTRGVTSGVPEAVITEASMRDVYDVDVRMTETSLSNGSRLKACVPVL
jgi:iron complex transport system ATP-binding protein